MKKMKRHICLMLVFMLMVTMLPMNVDAASKVKINKTKTTIYVGQTITLKASGAKNVKWSTSNKKVATVSSKGKVTAKKKGNATITVKAGKKKATCKVTVKNPFLNKTKVSLKKNETTTLKLTGAKVKAWSSNNKKVATVSSKGKITAKGTGSATITCKDKNNKKYTCKVTVTEKHTHKYTSQITTKATCTTNGVITYTCSCGDSYTESIPKTGHTSSDWIVDKKATCTEAGSRYKKCTVCGEKLQTESIAKTNHTFGKAVVTREATCTENGEKTIKCTKCGYAKYEEVPATGHTSSDWIVDEEATCTKTGSRHIECTICHQTLKTEEIQVTHTYDNGKVTKEPTCSSEGVKTYTCTKCGETKTETIAKMLHTSSNWIVDKEATCTENGSKHKECTVCGETLETESLNATGHTYDAGKVTKAATCKEAGVKTYTCTKCKETKTESIAKLAHTSSDWIVDKEATCTENGSKHKECTVCGETFQTESIEATGHDYVVAETKAATCTEEGYTEYKCTKCNDTYKDNITKATGHTYGEFVETVTPADFETFGSADMVCPKCKEKLFANLTAVKVDIGNGSSTTMYGYYDYDEAKKCFDLTYKYKVDNDILGKYGFVWNEDAYKYACIRTAEMAYQFDTMGEAFHERPNGANLGCGENLLYIAVKWIGMNPEPVELTAEEAFEKWLASEGHRDNIEMKNYRKMSAAKFKVWIPSKESWSVFWTQSFY